MGGELKLHAQPVVGTWVMFSRGRGSKLLQMNATALTVFPLSLLLEILLLHCEVFGEVLISQDHESCVQSFV